MTEYARLIDSFNGIACVVSLKRTGADAKDEVVITAANRDYLASVGKQDEEFVPGRSYEYYVAQDPNFVALVNSCISTRKISHQYVNAELYGAWLDLYMIPLEDDEEGNGYCLFTYEMTPVSDSDKMVDISAKTAYMVLKTCIKFREKESFKVTLDSIVKDIRSQCESDGCAIILTDTEARKIDMLSFDHMGNFAPEEEDIFFRPEFYEIVEGWRDVIGGSNCIIVANEEELKQIEKKDVNWYNSLVFSGVRNLVLYPLRTLDNLYGYIFATNFNSDKTTFIREVMELNSFVLSAEVENYRMRKKLERLSTTDALTGVLNRNALNRKIKKLSDRSEYPGLGAVYVDVNGLKTVNDSLGHNEGDILIKKVADKLKEICKSEEASGPVNTSQPAVNEQVAEIYRAGGDEFLILTTDLSRDEFYALFEKMKAVSRVKGEPAFALGANFDDGDMDIKAIMHIADQNMYKNKAEYYEMNPELDRRIR